MQKIGNADIIDSQRGTHYYRHCPKGLYLQRACKALFWYSLSPMSVWGNPRAPYFFQIQVELDLKYQPPEGAAGTWAEEDFGTPIRDR